MKERWYTNMCYSGGNVMFPCVWYLCLCWWKRPWIWEVISKVSRWAHAGYLVDGAKSCHGALEMEGMYTKGGVRVIIKQATLPWMGPSFWSTVGAAFIQESGEHFIKILTWALYFVGARMWVTHHFTSELLSQPLYLCCWFCGGWSLVTSRILMMGTWSL